MLKPEDSGMITTEKNFLPSVLYLANTIWMVEYTPPKDILNKERSESTVDLQKILKKIRAF